MANATKIVKANKLREQFVKADKLYERGRYKEASKTFMALAQKGDTSGMTRLALMYYEGKGVSYSFEKSVYWDTKAAEAGDVVGMLNLGVSFRRAGDVRKARSWFEKALEQGDGSAALELAKMYLVSDLEISRVKRYLKIAATRKSLSESEREETEQLLDELGTKSA